MFTVDDLIEGKEDKPDVETPYQQLAGGDNNSGLNGQSQANNMLSQSSVVGNPSNCCSCSDVCECITVNTKAGAVVGGWLTTVAGGMVGACCIGPPLVLFDFCCFPLTENHDCFGRLCKVCGVAAAIPGAPAGVGGATACGIFGFVTGLLCSPVAFFGGKPKCYTGANEELNIVVKDIYNDIMGNESDPPPSQQRMR